MHCGTVALFLNPLGAYRIARTAMTVLYSNYLLNTYSTAHAAVRVCTCHEAQQSLPSPPLPDGHVMWRRTPIGLSHPKPAPCANLPPSRSTTTAETTTGHYGEAFFLLYTTAADPASPCHGNRYCTVHAPQKDKAHARLTQPPLVMPSVPEAGAETRPRCPETCPRQTLRVYSRLSLHNFHLFTTTGRFMRTCALLLAPVPPSYAAKWLLTLPFSF